MSDVNEPVYLTKQELAARWRVKTRTIEMWVREGKCPKPFKPAYKTALWLLNDIVAHENAIRERVAAENKKNAAAKKKS